MKDIIFQKGKVLITEKIFKTPRRTYKIRVIERIQIKRPWFVFSVPLGVGAICLLSLYVDYLYPTEKFVCVFIAAILPILLYNIGILSVTSKAYLNDTAVIGSISKLSDIRDALESVMHFN